MLFEWFKDFLNNFLKLIAFSTDENHWLLQRCHIQIFNCFAVTRSLQLGTTNSNNNTLISRKPF